MVPRRNDDRRRRSTGSPRRAARSRCSTAGCSPRCRTFRLASATGTSASPRPGRWTIGRIASPMPSSATPRARPCWRSRCSGRPSSSATRPRSCSAAPTSEHASMVCRRRCGPSSTSRRGSRLELGGCVGPGMRGVVAVAGGFDVPQHLGSASTFVLGGFGGHGGRALRAGDVIPIGESPVGHEDRGVERARRGTAGAHGRLGDRRPRRPARRA